MLMKICDISNISRPTQLARRWAEILLVEFFGQGDAERVAGLPVTPWLDRTKTTLPGSQIGFIAGVGVPAYEKLVRFMPELSFLTDQLQTNVQYWKDEKARLDAEAAAAAPPTTS